MSRAGEAREVVNSIDSSETRPLDATWMFEPTDDSLDLSAQDLAALIAASRELERAIAFSTTIGDGAMKINDQAISDSR